MTVEVTHDAIKVSRQNALVTVSLNRPHARNAIAGAMMRDLHGALLKIAADASIRVMVLRGEGRDFCPGADIGAYEGRGETSSRPAYGGVREFDITVLLHQMPAVTIAAIRGGCAGAGFGWACACDLRIADDTARFNPAFLDVGVAGDMGLPWTLPRLVGAAKARELCFMPGKFDAAEAQRLGLLTALATEAQFEAELMSLTDRMLASAPLAPGLLKSNFTAAEKMSFAEFIALESERHVRVFQSEDTTEAFRAFTGKRRPNYVGR